MRFRWWIIGLVMLVVLPTQAQTELWSAWVYDNGSGRAAYIAATGAVQHDLILPVLAEFDAATVRYSNGLAVSPDGSRLAYRVSGLNTAGLPLSAVLIYDTSTQQSIAAYQPPLVPLDDTFSFVDSVSAFNESGSAVAYSFIASATGSVPDQWGVVVLDVLTGNVLFELSNLSPAVQAQLGTDATAFLPIVQAYEGAAVQLTLFPYELQGGGIYTSYQWDVLTGRIFTTAQYPALVVDHLPATNETLLPIFDERLPNRLGESGGLALAQNNALQVWTADIGGRIPFFGSSDFDIRTASFIENGERVVFSAFDLANNSGTFWRIAERNGTVFTIPTISAVDNRVLGTPNGFTYMTDASPAQLIEARTRTDGVEQVALWTATPDFRPRLVWVSPPTVSQAVLPDWVQLAEPIFPDIPLVAQAVSPEEIATLDPITTSGGVLTVNNVALVNTTEGDRLNMRESPGLSGQIIARVEHRSRVILLEGPRPLDGFIWWRIRLSTGLEGWVVQEADGVETLIPAN